MTRSDQLYGTNPQVSRVVLPHRPQAGRFGSSSVVPNVSSPLSQVTNNEPSTPATTAASSVHSRDTPQTRKLESMAWVHEDARDPYAAQEPGTLAYYKSAAFRKKKLEGSVQVPGVAGEVCDEDDSYMEDDFKPAKPKLMMTFGMGGNVRRAASMKKADLRMQRSNKRT